MPLQRRNSSPVPFLAVLGYVGQRDLYSSHTGSLYWPYHRRPINTSDNTNKRILFIKLKVNRTQIRNFDSIFFPLGYSQVTFSLWFSFYLWHLKRERVIYNEAGHN